MIKIGTLILLDRPHGDEIRHSSSKYPVGIIHSTRGPYFSYITQYDKILPSGNFNDCYKIKIISTKLAVLILGDKNFKKLKGSVK